MVIRLRPKMELNLPFEEKEEAKKLTPKPAWDNELKKWFIPEGVPSEPFSRWLPTPIWNVRSDYFFIAKTRVKCWKCKQVTAVYGVILPIGHELLDSDKEKNLDILVKRHFVTTLSYISWLHPDTEGILKRDLPDHRYSVEENCYANHCDYCNAKQSDFYLFCEPGQGFHPTSKEDAYKIIIKQIDHEFTGVVGSFSEGVKYFQYFKQGDI
jgi:hypothetical protein